ncbi:MAG: alkaline shock response membrane anchor protein AmaP, partial [Nitrospirota bacterium]|nr:alkaline shock response membrane anchor protein AmaP [Nitrospirota bacterium]
MRFLKTLGVYFYSAALILIGLGLIIFSIIFSVKNTPIQPQDIIDFTGYIQNSASTRIAIGLSGALLILISSWLAEIILGRFQREKTIAFPTASGEVTIALTAVEGLIKRLAALIPGIKELRPDVIASKKGIIADLKVVLKSEANIPELTKQLQEITRAKIQEVLGIEEQIIIKIHVIKIMEQEEK